MARLTALVLIAVAVAAGCDGDDEDPSSPSPPPPNQSTAEDLRGRSFVSTAATDGGEPRELVDGTRIKITFTPNGNMLGWRAGCNSFGADLEITESHLEVGQVVGTLIGCPDDLQRQEGWVSEFLGSDPSWSLEGQGLTLTSGDRAIEFVAGRPRTR